MIWIGTSGWVYPHWVGPFYPPDLPVREHLPLFPALDPREKFVGQCARFVQHNDPYGAPLRDVHDGLSRKLALSA